MATTIVYIGVGSNIDKYKNIDGCLTDLSSHFKKIEISPIYQSKAIGMDADDFYNLVVKFETNCQFILAFEGIEGPTGIVVDGTKVYVADRSNRSIVEFDQSGN